MLLAMIRTVILFTITVVFLRVMGKRQVGQLQPYELVIIIMFSELAAIPMQNIGVPIISGIIPILVLFGVDIVLAYVSLKSDRMRSVINGKPSVLIENSKIVESELRRLRYNINDLLEQLRSKNVANISDVEYAILETSGDLSVILKSQRRPVVPEDLNLATQYEGLPYPLIIDGRVIDENLQKVNLNVDSLKNELGKFGINRLKDVLFASLDTQGRLYYQTKEPKQKPNQGGSRQV